MNQMFVYSADEIIDLVFDDLQKKGKVTPGKKYMISADIRRRFGMKPDLIFEIEEK